MQFTWQGCDSILAGALVLDLARLALFEQRRGEVGVMRHLACFFKSPMGVEEHDFFKQFAMLEQYVQRQQVTATMRLAFSTNAYLKFSFAEAARRLAAIGYDGLEIMADVPHAWPACLARRAKRGHPRRPGAKPPRHLEHQRVHDERHQRPTAALLAPVLDRAGSALSAGSHRSHLPQP